VNHNKESGKLKEHRIEVFLARIFLAILSVLITFVVLEAVSRRFLTTRSQIEQSFPATDEMRHAKPYVMFSALSKQNTFNAFGYRGAMATMPKPRDEYRVFMLGGSTVLLGNPTISTLLEMEFKKSGHPNVKVYNCGVLSSVSGMELVRILYEFADLDPDLVIMFNGGNDIIVPWESDPRPGYPFNFVVVENNPLFEKPVQDYPAFRLFAFGSNLCRYFLHDYFMENFFHLNRIRRQTGWKSDPWREKIAGAYVSNLVKSAKVSSAFGADFIVFFQPTIFFKHPLNPREESYLQNPDKVEQGNYVRDMRTRILARLENASKTTTLNWVDSTHIYDGLHQKIFSDAIHTSPAGRNAVAHAMHQHISNLFAQRLAASSKNIK